MKIFTKTEGQETVVYFVDENDVVISYDITLQCCEQADYYFTDSDPTKPHCRVDAPRETAPYNFVADMQIDDVPVNQPMEAGCAVCAVAFKLVADNTKYKYGWPDLYLVLVNHHKHDGCYYPHKFMIKTANSERQDSL